MAQLSQIAQVPENVMFRDLGGEAVLLELDAGRYYGLDAVGTRMFQLIDEHGHLARVWRSLEEEFEASSERLKTELLEFVELLRRAGLLELTDAT